MGERPRRRAAAGAAGAGAGRLQVGVTMRPAILFTTLLVAGLQVFFGAFFLSMLGISRGDYVGDYTRD